MSSQFDVCTYNQGISANDYLFLCKHLEPSFAIKSQEKQDEFLSKYDTVQKRTTELLTDKAAVYCLQEVGDEKRPLIESLKGKKFKIIHCEELYHFSCAIALDTSRFKDINNFSMDVQVTDTFKKDVAIATATEISSNQKFTFVSAHVPGFDFSDVTEKTTADGDIYCKAIAKKLAEIGNNTIRVIGADMNANPEKWQPRFEIFSRLGYQIQRTNAATNVNVRDQIDKEREIDFLLVKKISSIWQKIKSFFVAMLSWDAAIKQDHSVAWNADDNASDHIPVYIEISSKMHLSKIHQVWKWLCSHFRTQQQQIA